MITSILELYGKTIKTNDLIWWVKDTAGVIVIDQSRNKYWILVGKKEDLWQFLAMKISYENIIKIIELSFNLSRKSAEGFFMKQIITWQHEGIIQISDH